MKPILSIAILFISLTTFGQNPLAIEYRGPVDTIIYRVDTLGKEKQFYIDFINKAGQIIKNRERQLEENHQSKNGYIINDNKTYFFYKDSILISDITFVYGANNLLKTEYEFNNQGKLLKATFFSYKKKLHGDTLLKFNKGDYYLNNPSAIPTQNWDAYRIDKKSYNEDGNIIYRGYLFKWGRGKTIDPDREQYFVYNKKKQLIEHTSLTRTGYESNLMQTFEYDCDGKIVKENSYSDGRYQAYTLYTYSDSVMFAATYFLNTGFGNEKDRKINPYSKSSEANAMRSKYILDPVTKKYIEEKSKREFKICDEAQ